MCSTEFSPGLFCNFVSHHPSFGVALSELYVRFVTHNVFPENCMVQPKPNNLPYFWATLFKTVLCLKKSSESDRGEFLHAFLLHRWISSAHSRGMGMENGKERKKTCFPTKCGKHDPEFPPPARKSGNFGVCLFFLFFNGVLMETLLPFSLARKWHTQSWQKKSPLNTMLNGGHALTAKAIPLIFPLSKGIHFCNFWKAKNLFAIGRQG